MNEMIVTPAPGKFMASNAISYAHRIGTGLVFALFGSLAGIALHEVVDWISPLVVAVLIGALAANVGLIHSAMRPGLKWSARHILRSGIVLVGFRLSLREVAHLGPRALAAVCVVVVATFFGTQWLGRRLGLSSGLSLLVATGYSICGASAIAAAEPFADATEEEVAYSIALVTLCGSLSIAVLPAIGSLLGLGDALFGAWVGASVHDVGQVVAAASTRNSTALKAAVIVKLTRVVLLAPLLAGIAVAYRRRHKNDATALDGDAKPLPPILPMFVALFLVAVAIRTSGVLNGLWLARLKNLETLLMGMGLVGLGAGVSVAKLRAVGGRPLALGLLSWVLVAVVSLGAARLAA
ncbi:MAG: putative sulfate exporter family transporter [Actinobacteria bacterium]|nr:putative sulfate exporter family transporter [Actinomycetota bacterium]